MAEVQGKGIAGRTRPTKRRTGDYNAISTVAAGTTAWFTGSACAAGFICESVAEVVITAPGGSTISGSALTAKTLYPIGVEKVTIGAGGGIVHVLRR